MKQNSELHAGNSNKNSIINIFQDTKNAFKEQSTQATNILATTN